MGECEFIAGCPFFKGEMAGKDDQIEALKDNYCRSNSLHCSRYLVASAVGKENMPGDLFPDEKERAYLVIAEHS